MRLQLDYAAMVLAIQDEFCLLETCLQMAEDGVRSIYLIVPTTHWDGQPTRPDQIEQLRTIQKAVRQRIPCHFRLFDYTPGKTASDSETNVRTMALEWIQQTYDHVLIVDADELWIKGRLTKLDEVVAKHRPLGLTVSVIPTIGVPGLPVANAGGLNLVYLSNRARISWCRGYQPDETSIELKDAPSMYHFSATRRTLQEVIDKCRKSSHYDDPAYEFETWIKDVLPNVHPGMWDVHMYRPGVNIWPVVRSWTAEEWQEIPESLHPYLVKPT